MRSQRLLICLKSYIGDAVMALPMIEALESRFGAVTVQTAPVVQQLLVRPGRTMEFMPLQRQRGPWSTIRSALALRRRGFDTAVLVNRSFRAALVAKLARIPRRIGHAREGRSKLLTSSLPYRQDEFEAESCLDLARALGCNGPAVPILCPLEDDLQAGRRAIGAAVVGLQPGARYPKKQLPPEVIVSLGRKLTESGYGVALLGGPDERGMVDTSRIGESVVDIVGATTIRATIGAAASLRVVVGSDTGLMHVVAAVGTPTVTVFGPTNAAKWGHHYRPHQVVIAPDREMSKVCVDELYAATVRSLAV